MGQVYSFMWHSFILLANTYPAAGAGVKICTLGERPASGQSLQGTFSPLGPAEVESRPWPGLCGTCSLGDQVAIQQSQIV